MDMVNFRPKVMMPRPVVMMPRPVVMMPRNPRIGPNGCMMMGSVMACAMDAGTMLAMHPPAVTVRPGIRCKKEKSNGCQ